MKLSEVRYKFVYFWDSFFGDNNSDIITESELQKYLLPFLKDEQKAKTIEEANLIIYSIFNHDNIEEKFAKLKLLNPNAIIIHWSGEPHIGSAGPLIDLVFGTFENIKNLNNSAIETNNSSVETNNKVDNKANYENKDYYGFLGLMYLRHILMRYNGRPLFTQIKDKNREPKFCSIVCGALTTQRKLVYEKINEYQKVDGFGSAFPYCSSSQPPSHTGSIGRYWDYDYLKLLSQYKFNICLENTFRPGYNTEKVVNALLAGVIPIYWGSETIFEFVNKDRILYLNKDLSNLDDIIKRIDFLNKNQKEYDKMVNLEPFVKPIEKIEECIGSYSYMSSIIKNSILRDKKKPINPIKYKNICINLQKRPDRLKKVLAEFQKSNLIVEIFKAVDGYELTFNDELHRIFKNNNFCYAAGCIGCALSHYYVLKQLLNDKNYDAYMIFEDDVELDALYNQKFQTIINQLPENYGMLYLGYSALKCRPNNSYIYLTPLTGKVCGTYGYLISKELARVIVEDIEKNGIGSAIDDYYHTVRQNSVMKAYISSSPIIASSLSQVSGDTDVQNRIPIKGLPTTF